MPALDLPNTALLAFDTSTERLSVGLRAGGRRWVDNRPGGAAASAALLPAVQALMEQAGCRMSDLGAIGFGCGPGAFTGLRTSCAVAQGLAVGLNLPVLSIDSLLLVAEQARQQTVAGSDFEVDVAMDARMGQAYAARYAWRHGGWQVVQPPSLWSPDALAAAWADQRPAAVCGTAIDLFGALASAAAPARRIVVGDDRASAVLELALQAWTAGLGLDAADALPVYLRDKVAQTTDERTAARVAAARDGASAVLP